MKKTKPVFKPNLKAIERFLEKISNGIWPVDGMSAVFPLLIYNEKTDMDIVVQVEIKKPLGAEVNRG
jgi:hypothetical protein